METATMTLAEFEALPNYSVTNPTGQTIGKRWKRKQGEFWYLCEYAKSQSVGYVDVLKKQIVITESNLHNKYIVAKKDGSPVDPKAQYFVLRIDTDAAARDAVLNYANYINGQNPGFATELRNWVNEYR